MFAKSLLALFATALFQAPAKDTSAYTKSVTTTAGLIEMSTSAQQLVCPGKPDVWLVGAVHIGSKDYYSNLQKLLDQQSLVLFEGVKSEKNSATKPATTAQGKDQPKPIYKALSDALGLEFQLTSINYDHKNWENCDLTWEAMDKSNSQSKTDGKGAGSYDQIRKLLDPNSPQAKQFVTILDQSSPGMREAMKIMIVKSVANGDVQLDEATEKLVIAARNKVVTDRIAVTAKSEKAPKTIAVFYGAKHLPSMEHTLMAEQGYKLGKQQWFTAANADPKKVDQQGQMLLDMLDQQKKAGKGGGGLPF